MLKVACQTCSSISFQHFNNVKRSWKNTIIKHKTRGQDISRICIFITADQPRLPEPPSGPLLSRFRGLGALSHGQLVAGPWGDCSSHLHKLFKYFSEQRVAAEGRACEWVPGAGALAVGEVRRSASVCIVRAQQVCLLERLAFLAPRANVAAQLRQTTLRLKERRRKEAQACCLAFQRGGLGRKGREFIP